MTIIGGEVYKISMIFEVFWEYHGDFSIFLREIFFDSKILSSCCDKHHILIMGALLTLKTRLKVPIVAVFWGFWAFFELFVFTQAFSLGHWSCKFCEASMSRSLISRTKQFKRFWICGPAIYKSNELCQNCFGFRASLWYLTSGKNFMASRSRDLIEVVYHPPPRC